ncbi:GNAT family N-acetyltransferase [Microbispora catharanthi]|uniref:GNAT family N-acetyltransferase n=1 Tax=Microbispora catharanthi TaxID=1712871 RepID=A0A5N6C257_9ACTN|nr:GNAT family N-acetyltransferase [Microbispora catharanthi]KAB8186580.1 GNAT family N-acetyltransferase [Microbispora catharanthi]
MKPADPSALPVRRLGLADLPHCLDLAQDRSWPREERKWRLLLENGEGFGVDAPDGGGLAGTVVLTRYGRTAAAVGMMLVASRYGGRGLGRRLLDHVLAEAGDATLFLCATEFGRPLYEKLGFETVGVIEARVGRFDAGDDPHGGSGPGRSASRLAEPRRDLAALCALDIEVFGADRSRLLARLFAFAEQVRVAERDREITGYGAAWRSGDRLFVGPVVAEDDETARALITDLARDADIRIRIDLDHRRQELISWIAGRGVPQSSTTSFMVHGGRALPGDRSRLVASFMSALG